MTPKFIQLLEKCITDGVVFGHNRAYKHKDNPDRYEINESIVNSVLDEIYEWFDFEIDYQDKRFAIKDKILGWDDESNSSG